MLSVPAGQKQTFLWVGTDNITVLSFYRQNGVNKFVLSAQNEECVQDVSMDDNTWTWFTLYWEFRSYADTINNFWVHVNTVNVSAPATCTTQSRTVITSLSGRVLFGGEPVTSTDGPYQSFASMEVDDIIYKETFHKVYSKWYSGWEGARRDFNWFYPYYYLEWVAPTDLYRMLFLIH